ncbi:MAG: hypothetical protein AAB214_03085, partial [Fibrobacterota bacterium]
MITPFPETRWSSNPHPVRKVVSASARIEVSSVGCVRGGVGRGLTNSGGFIVDPLSAWDVR